MAISIRRRSLVRLFLFAGFVFVVRFLVLSPASPASSSVKSFYSSDPQEIKKHGVLELVTRGEKLLDARKHKFLQVRMGRDERDDLLSETIKDGYLDYWERFQEP